jgi:UDP-N-acetylmuramoyl-L-alanyl-D-glutamate--2,6-diaminopimelate ligase
MAIYNREEAINYAINLLDENDVLLILGKGHERYQEIGNRKIYFSDKVIVNKYIEKKKK